MSHHTRIISLAFASALAWTAAAADPAGNSSQTPSASSTSPTKPPVAADGPPPARQTPTPRRKPRNRCRCPCTRSKATAASFPRFSAYLVNPPRNGEPVGRPSIGFGYINMGYGRDLVALTLTETPWERLELGFGYDLLNLGDLPTAIVQSRWSPD